MQQVIRSGRLSHPEALLLARTLEPGDRLVELGGGIGYTSTLAAKQGKAACIVTFEPNPGLMRAMRQTHALNEVKVTGANAVVMSRKDFPTVPFYVHEDFWVSSLSRPDDGRVKEIVDVPVLAFGDVLAEFEPTMLMIDIEGAELELLEHAELPSVRKILLELHVERTGEVGVKRIFDALSQRSFCYDPKNSAGAVVMFRRLPGWKNPCRAREPS
jgi:FkbM family methyltransferase